jgi:SAM-dependent methyltransferase
LIPTLGGVIEDASEGRETHWDTAYRDRGVSGVSWFQSEPTLSLDLIERLDIAPEAEVIDIGGGASSLVDRLVERGFTDVSVLDLSEAALNAGRQRVGGAAGVKWLHEDLLSWHPSRRYGLWHDRAVFHFLTEAADRDRYLGNLRSGLEPGGGLVMATFAEDGPEYCSGLAVARYGAQDLLDLLGEGYYVIEVRREMHSTPGGVTQPFTWLAARAAAGGSDRN